MSNGHRLGNDSVKARKAKAKSPWSRGPNCAGKKAMRSFRQYEQRGRSQNKDTPA